MARTKGATSLINVPLKQIEKFCGPETTIPVSRTWMRKLGFLSEDGHTVNEDKINLQLEDV